MKFACKDYLLFSFFAFTYENQSKLSCFRQSSSEINVVQIETPELFYIHMAKQIEHMILLRRRKNRTTETLPYKELYPAKLLYRLKNTYVYKVEHDGIVYAIKRTKKMFSECREVEISNAVNHKNIIKIYAAFYHKNRDFYYIFMEYLPVKLPLSWSFSRKTEQILNAAIDVAHAVKYLNDEHDISHNDIKTENVRGIKENDKITWKLFDFGLSLKIEDDEILYYTIGTIGYMAPETLYGEQVVRKSDVFGIGMMLFYLDMGWYKVPMPRLRKDVYQDICRHKLKLLKYIKYSNFCDELDRILLFDPYDRPTIDELIQILTDE